MYLNDLIEEAQKALKDNGNIPVTVYADHGQDDQAVISAYIEWLDEDGDAVSGEYGNKVTKVFNLYAGGKITC